MKILFFAAYFTLFSTFSHAETKSNIDPAIVEFSKTMGIESLITATLQQTRDALHKSMKQLTQELKKQYPDLNDEQNKLLNQIFNAYSDSILGAVDPAQAAYIYADIISKGMPKEEIQLATDYYRSPEGQRLLNVVATANSGMSQFLLDYSLQATKIAREKLKSDLSEFHQKVTNDKPK